MPEYHLRLELGRFLSHLFNVTDHSILTALLNNTLKLAKHEDIGRILTLKLFVSVQLQAPVALIRQRELPISLHTRHTVGLALDRI